ncbi:MAG: CotH kinase family protein [Pirellulaceae bacterium]
MGRMLAWPPIPLRILQSQCATGPQSHPSISLVTDAAHLFDRETGIQSNPQSRGVAWERPVSMEWITEQGVQQIQIDAGLRMQGNASRNPDRPKHNMRLLFKERYGASKLEFPLFPESDVDQFDTFILRGGNGDSWFHPNATQQGQAQYIRDQWSRETQREMGRFTVSQRYVHLYINGLYWGLYHIFERVNASFFAEHLGGEPADYDVLAHKNETVDGNRDAWDQMMRIARTDTESAESYQAIQQFIDLPALADYLLIGFYAANTDWDQNNWFGGRKRDDGAQFQFFTWDAERTFVSVNTDRTTFNNSNQPSELHQRLSRNEEYRLMFADLINEHFFNDGTLTPAAAEARWLKFAAEIEIPLAAESARWGDAKRRSRPYTPDREWKAELDRLQRTWFPRRTDIVLQQLRRRGLYPDTVAPTFSQHGGEYAAGFQLAMTAPDGVIYYTTDGSDPRLPGGNISGSAKLFDGPFALAGDVTVKARTWLAGEWSALNDTTFLAPSVAADDRSLRISEIHYHPGSPSEAEIAAGFADADEFEFLELMNVSDQVIRLDDVKLVEVLIDGSEQGVAFDFAGSDWQRLSPGERLILVENQDAFVMRYGTELPVAGQWNGKLSNGGEYLTVENSDGILLQFQYDDNWYPDTDGAGSSLELIDPVGSGEQWFVRQAWQASIVGGTPGSQARAVRVAGDSTGDGIFNSADLVAVFQAGEYEDGVAENSTFEEGDWNGDGEFSTQDLVFAFQQGTYVAAAVPWTVNRMDSVFRTNRTSPIDRHWDAAEDSRSVGPNLKRNLRVLAVDDFFQDFYC